MTTITLYHWDEQGIYSYTSTVGIFEPMPLRSTPRETPETTPPQVAAWRNNGWVVLPERPTPPEPQPQPEPVPTSCARRQGRLALLGVGKLDLVESAIAAIEDPTERMAAQIEYEADTWERDNAFLQAMWAQLGGTEQQLDDLFREAVTL